MFPPFDVHVASRVFRLCMWIDFFSFRLHDVFHLRLIEGNLPGSSPVLCLYSL